MAAPRISVIAPLYNVRDYVGECIASLRAQTCGDFEALFVDDGSDDASLEAAREAAVGDARFRFFSCEHGGQSRARNFALEQATGDYVMFLDSDDAYAPEAIETVLARMDAHNLDAYYFTALMRYDDHSLVRTNFESFMERVPSEGILDGFHMLMHFCATDSFRPSACMFALRREVVEQAGLRFHPGIIHEDLLFTMQVFPLLKRCVFELEPLYIRRMRHGSTMTKARSLENVEGLFTVARELEACLKRHLSEWSPEFIDAYCSRIHATWMQLARDAQELGDAQMHAYRATLSPQDRADFDLHVLEPARQMGELQRLYTESTTYKAGKLLMALPTWLKDRLKPAPK